MCLFQSSPCIQLNLHLFLISWPCFFSANNPSNFHLNFLTCHCNLILLPPKSVSSTAVLFYILLFPSQHYPARVRHEEFRKHTLFLALFHALHPSQASQALQKLNWIRKNPRKITLQKMNPLKKHQHYPHWFVKEENSVTLFVRKALLHCILS